MNYHDDDPADSFANDEALYFDDTGRPCAVEIPQTSEQALEAILKEHGVEDQEVLLQIDEIVDRRAEKRAASFVRRVFERLEGTAASIALRWVVLGTGEETMREEATKIGVTHQAILKAAKLIRKKLGYQQGH